MSDPSSNRQTARRAVAELMASERDYDQAVRAYRFRCPEYFNFAFDVIDDIAERRDKTAVIAVSGEGEVTGQYRYSDLSRRSSRLANALAGLGLARGDFAVLVAGREIGW